MSIINTFNNDEYLMYATFKPENINKFINTIKDFKLFKSNLMFIFNNENLIIKNGNCSSLLMYSLIIPSYNFKKYFTYKDNYNVSISLDSLDEAFNRLQVTNDDKLTLNVSKKTDTKLNVIIKKSKSSSISNINISINLLNSNLNSIPKISSDYKCQVYMKTDLFYSYINDIKSYSRYLKVNLTQNKFTLSSYQSKNNIINHNIIHEFDNIKINDNNRIVKVSVDYDYLQDNKLFEFNCIYDIEIIKEIYSIIKNCEYVDIRFGTNTPLCLRFDVKYFGTFVFFISNNNI